MAGDPAVGTIFLRCLAETNDEYGLWIARRVGEVDIQVNGLRVLAGASVLAAVLGSVHAFSVFIAPLEALFSVSRGQVSLTYSGALICLTLIVLLGHRIYPMFSAPVLCLATVGLGAAGALTASLSGSMIGVWIGYSLLFGLANGLGYGFGLQIAAQANAGREGLAMGCVTAAYALGAVLAPLLFAQALAHGGFSYAMTGLAVVLLGAGACAALLMQRVRYRADPAPSDARPVTEVRRMWLGYFGGVMAGLMVIGHAAAIARVLQPEQALWIAPALVAACNLLGSLIAGRAVDTLRAKWVLPGLSAITCLGLLILVLLEAAGMLLALAMIGFAYGGTIAAWPPVIAKRVGMARSAMVYGQVFTAWGVAGLAGPWLAGALFDGTGTYGMSLLIAAGFGAVATALSWRLFSATAQTP